MENASVAAQPSGSRRRGLPTTDWTLLGLVTVVLTAGVGCWFTGAHGPANLLWGAATVAATVPAVWWVVGALRHGHTGADVIAVLALVGSLAVGQFLAGALIALMLTSGRTLESYAAGRAARDLHGLLAHAPQFARRRSADGTVTVVPLDQVGIGDELVVGPGEVVPVDGTLVDRALLDESVLTGEALPIDRDRADRVASGVVNAGPAFGLVAVAGAADSTYAGIVRLAGQATADQAPSVRLADRYAAAFIPISLVTAGLAWILSGAAVRAVAVLVVATPCPLLLATPIAIVSGLSRAARRGIVIRNGAALETLGQARTLLVDKTGTLTAGRPRLLDVIATGSADPDEALRLAASLEQLSPHVLAGAIVRTAAARDLPCSAATDVVEEPGRGISGLVDGHRVRVGRLPHSATEQNRPTSSVGSIQSRAELEGAVVTWVSVDGAPAAALLLVDPIRPDAVRTIRRLREAGFTRIVMLTGDRPPAAQAVARHLGLDEAVAQCTPAGKVAYARRERRQAVTVVVGDGVNDAPALASADVGVAMGARGATASAQVADAVLTVDRLDRLADAVAIAQRARRIAVQSAAVGMGLSLVAMAAAAAGLLAPAAGAFLQEGIDVLVILNALRALGGRVHGRRLAPGTHALLTRFAAEHEQLSGALRELRVTADLIATSPADPSVPAALRRVHRRLSQEILPHEHAEERRLYPALAKPLGSGEATATMSSAHVEIDRLADRIATHLALAEDAGLRPEQRPDLLASLYGLDAVLRLHFAQEEEHYFSLAPPADERPAAAGAPAADGARAVSSTVR